MTADEGDLFPWAKPPGLFKTRETFGAEVRCKPLLPFPLSSHKSQSTAIATSVQTMPEDSQLISVKQSKEFWPNLKRYADDKSGGVGADHCTTWSFCPSIPLADRLDQVSAISGLAGWYTAQANRSPEILVNCELAVQDEVQAQIIAPLDFLIKVRRHC